MTDEWSVIKILRQITPTEEDDAALFPMCTAALEEIAVRLRDDADHSDIRIANAAAAIVSYRLSLKSVADTDSVTTFKAGDVSITRSAGAVMQVAREEKMEAMIALLPLLRDTEFIFMQV